MSKKSTIKNDPFALVVPDLANQEEVAPTPPHRHEARRQSRSGQPRRKKKS